MKLISLGRAGSTAGTTSAELVIATGITSMVMAAVLSSSFFVTKGLQSVSYYSQIHGDGRRIVNNFSRDVRAASAVDSFSSSSVALTIPTSFSSSGTVLTNKTVTYWVSANKLFRSDSSVSQTNLVVTNISQLTFSLYDMGGTNTVSLSAAKEVQVDMTLRKFVMNLAKSEFSGSARLAMRN